MLWRQSPFTILQSGTRNGPAPREPCSYQLVFCQEPGCWDSVMSYRVGDANQRATSLKRAAKMESRRLGKSIRKEWHLNRV